MKKYSKPGGFTDEFYQMFKEEKTPMLYTLLQKIDEGRKRPLFYEAYITLIPNCKGITKKYTQYASYI